MRFIVDGKPRESLAADELRRITPWHKPYEGAGVVLSAEQAGRRLGSGCLIWTAIVAVPIWVWFALYSLTRDPMLGDDRLAIAAIGVIVPLLLLALRPLLGRRERQRVLADLRESPPPGTRVAVGERGLTLGDRLFPWDALTIEQLGLEERLQGEDDILRAGSVRLTTPAGPVFLSRRVLEEGQFLVFEIHRRLWPRALEEMGRESGNI